MSILGKWRMRNVSIHAPARGATPLSGVTLAVSGFQFTHPRGVRLSANSIDSVAGFVSIHAPARGATQQRESLKKTQEVSIHAPARGATARKNI